MLQQFSLRRDPRTSDHRSRRAVELDACQEMGIAMFAGEAEGRLDIVLRDAAAGQLAPVYNFMKDLTGIEGTPVPFLPKRCVERTIGLNASFDAGRGCPYQCSFCTIINVQGRTSRYRSPPPLRDRHDQPRFGWPTANRIWVVAGGPAHRRYAAYRVIDV